MRKCSKNANEEQARIEAYNLPPTSAEAKQYANLVNAVMANKMHTYSKLGLNSLIVEDVNNIEATFEEQEFDDLSNWEHIYCEVEVHLEYRIMYEHARREYCEKAACCFQFGRI